ncbi:uncharacterized protein LOC141899458 isoform X1 [Tubulanus polymorphus]|uniref:uncharacterized protein LOC141899458 isoform X1 n=1 Tax=Tubulanus polymorphus TaxID=672921 RepID=UPI003DA4A988
MSRSSQYSDDVPTRTSRLDENSVEISLNDDDEERPSGIIYRSARNDPDAEDLPLPESRPGVQFIAPKERSEPREALPTIGGKGGGGTYVFQTPATEAPPAYDDYEDSTNSPRFGPRSPQHHNPSPLIQQPPVDTPDAAMPQPQKGRGRAKQHLTPTLQTESQPVSVTINKTASSPATAVANNSGMRAVQPDTYLVFSIIMCVLFFPLGIPAVLCSLNSDKAFKQENNSRKAKEYGLLAFYLNGIAGIALLTMILVILIMVFLPGATGLMVVI